MFILEKDLINVFKREDRMHYVYLEHQFGDNVSCECENRVKLLIEFGCYRLQNPGESDKCFYSCRNCQYNRMKRGEDEGYTYRL